MQISPLLLVASVFAISVQQPAVSAPQTPGQATAAQTAPGAPAEEAKAAVALVAGQYTIDSESKVPGTKKPLAKNGSWGVRGTRPEERPTECEAAGAVCRAVLYHAGQPETVCRWTVLTAAGAPPRIVDEDEAARTLMLRVFKQGDPALPRLILAPKPMIPPIAAAVHASGNVGLQAVVNEQGKVIRTGFPTGNEMLRNAATQAIERWTYEPFLVNGKARSFQVAVVVLF